MIIKNGKKYIPVKEAAKEYGKTVQRIYQLIKEGELDSYKVGNFIFVESKSKPQTA